MSHDHTIPAPTRAAVVVASDRCARGESEDRSGRRAVDRLRAAGYTVADAVIVPDGAQRVRDALDAALTAGARVVLTSGGTGVGPRDRTPEGTLPLIARELPGVAEAMRRYGAAQVPTAVLSRGLVGVTAGGAVLANLPGSVGGVNEGLDVLLPLLGHLLDQLTGGDHG